MLAAVRGYPDVVQALLEAGADPSLAGAEGLTPLILAAAEARVEVVQILLRAGASVAARDDWGRSASDYAIARGHPAVARLLQSAPQTHDD